MVSCGNQLFLFGGLTGLPSNVMNAMIEEHFPATYTRNHPQFYRHNEMFVYAISNVHDSAKIGYGLDFAPGVNTQQYTRKVHPIRSATSVIVPARNHFSATKINLGSSKVEVYLFGGRVGSLRNFSHLHIHRIVANCYQFNILTSFYYRKTTLLSMTCIFIPLPVM